MVMSDLGQQPSAETHLTMLGSARRLDDTELADLYAYPGDYPDRQRAWLRANFISSIDGAATVGGRSGGLAGPGDRVVFNVLRALADVVLVGAGTVRTENYAGARLGVAERRRRHDRGQSEVPQLAIVTRSGRLDRYMPVFTEGGPTLLGSFIGRGLLDELCLTVAPCVVGGQAPRIATGSDQVRAAMDCAHLLTDEAGYLYARYVKRA